LRFVPLIKACKKEWNTSVAKYADFWDAKAILQKLLCEPLHWQDAQQVRNRAIILLRLLHLCRSIDLARSWRRQSHHQGSLWWWLQRKGARRPAFEKLMDFSSTVPSLQRICPTAVLVQYVMLTSSLAKPGGKLFLSLNPPLCTTVCIHNWGDNKTYPPTPGGAHVSVWGPLHQGGCSENVQVLRLAV
jgi:hypothetical protein